MGDEEERRYFKQQEITLWRKGERVRKLPLANSLYQQQHALARHEAGDQPTEGVRTAPTPSQPPTPFAEGGKPLPGEVEEIKEEGEQQPEEKAPAPEDQLCEETKEKLVVSEKVEVSSSTKEESVTEEAQGPVPDLVPQGDQQQDNGGETDSLKDLDIVAVSESQCEARTATPDALDSPPAMPDSREGSLGASSPAVSLPDAPSSEPGSPQLQPKKEKIAEVASEGL